MTMNKTTQKDAFTISQLANELEISPSTIRFYEEKGLIRPERTPGNQRVYLRKHRARLKMILRGKRFGFSLDEIAEMIGLEEANMDEIEQIHRSQRFVDKKVEEIALRRTEMDFLEKIFCLLRRNSQKESWNFSAKTRPKSIKFDVPGRIAGKCAG